MSSRRSSNDSAERPADASQRNQQHTPSINPPFDQPVKSALVFSAFSMPRINALRGYVIENKLRPIFPSWTSPVRVPSPAPTNQRLTSNRPPLLYLVYLENQVQP